MNSDESDNWRVKKSQTPLTQGQSQPASSTPKESSSITKIEEQSNWRPRVAKPVDNVSETLSSDQSAWRNRAPKTESPPTDSSAWRNQTRPQRTDKVDQKAETSVNEKSNWRPTSVKDSAQDTLLDAKDNWRKPESAESRPLAKEEKSESIKSPESVATKKIPVFGDAKPVDTTAKYLETEAKLQETIPHKTNPWAKKSLNSSANEKPIDKLDWREKKTIPEQVKETVNVKVVEEMSKKPEPQLAPTPKINVWEERKKSKGAQQTSPVVTATISGKEDIGNKEDSVRRNVGGHDTVKGTVAGHDTIKGTVAGHDTIKGTVAGHDTIKGTVAGHDAIKGTVGGLGLVMENLSEQLTKEDAVASEDSASGAVGDAKISPRQGAVKISVNGPFLDPKSHRTPQHSVSEMTAISISSSPSASSIVTKTPTENPPIISMAQSPVSSKPSRIIGTNSSWSQGPPKGLKQQGQSMSSASGGH